MSTCTKRQALCIAVLSMRCLCAAPTSLDSTSTPTPPPQACMKMEGTSEAAPEAVRQAVGGGCQIGWGRLLSGTNAIAAGTCRRGGSGWP